MRVKYYIHQQQDNKKILHEYTSSLMKHMESGDKHPEIIHLIGKWSLCLFFARKKALKMDIPVVYSPFSTLNPWHKKRFPRLDGDLVIAMSNIEKESLDEIGYKNKTRLILNAIVTNATNEEEMFCKIAETYRYAIERKEQGIQRDIQQRLKPYSEEILHIYQGNNLHPEDTPEYQIIYLVLLIQRRIRRHDIPIAYLQSLHTLLLADNYDEQCIERIMQQLQITSFASNLFEVMQSETGLTEGFMPIPPHHGALANKIKQIITRY